MTHLKKKVSRSARNFFAFFVRASKFFFYLVQCMLSVAVGLLDFFPRLSVLEQKSPPRPEQLCVWLIGVILVVPYAANMSYFFVQKRRELWENEKSKARNTYLCKGAVRIYPYPSNFSFLLREFHKFKGMSYLKGNVKVSWVKKLYPSL